MGAALATVTVQHERATSPKQVRISANVKTAIDAMVLEGLNRKEAALRANLTDHALYCALTKPHVLAYRNDRLKVIRESAASRTIAKAEQLMDSAESEHVQADMTKWLAGLEGISVTQRTESNINFSGGPGLMIVMAPVEAMEHMIRDQQNQTEIVSNGRMLQAPVPHPSLRNVAGAVDVSGEIEPGRSGAGVQK